MTTTTERNPVTFETLRHLPADELREGDWPVSIAGFRPIQRIRKFPRKRRVDCWIDGQRYTLQAADTIGKVRRPLGDTEAFDPFASQIKGVGARARSGATA